MTSSGDRHQDCGVQVQTDQHEYIIETIVNDHVLIRTSSCANKDKISLESLLWICLYGSAFIA